MVIQLLKEPCIEFGVAKHGVFVSTVKRKPGCDGENEGRALVVEERKVKEPRGCELKKESTNWRSMHASF